jgi:hypothetical protein
MDFVEGFPWVGGKSVILTVMDCFSMLVQLIALSHPYSACSVVRSFFDNTCCSTTSIARL